MLDEHALPLPEPTREDYGFFGPESVTWRVWTAPTALIGFQRAVSIEAFDPFLTAAVADQRGVYTNAKGRFDRTAGYFLTVVLADGPSAIRASRALHRFHERAVGIEPISGKPYSANDPESQLWIHLTAWHSILKCYEQFGPGKLRPDEELEYWAQCRIAAELQTCDPATVPGDRAEVREYFEQVRPRLCLGEPGRELFRYLLRPALQPEARLLSATFRTFTRATVATLPTWMRQLGGVDQSRATDVAATVAARALMRAWSPVPARLAFVRQLTPKAAVPLEAALRGAEPRRPVTVTPAQAAQQLDDLVAS